MGRKQAKTRGKRRFLGAWEPATTYNDVYHVPQNEVVIGGENVPVCGARFTRGQVDVWVGPNENPEWATYAARGRCDRCMSGSHAWYFTTETVTYRKWTHAA